MITVLSELSYLALVRSALERMITRFDMRLHLLPSGSKMGGRTDAAWIYLGSADGDVSHVVVLSVSNKPGSAHYRRRREVASLVEAKTNHRVVPSVAKIVIDLAKEPNPASNPVDRLYDSLLLFRVRDYSPVLEQWVADRRDRSMGGWAVRKGLPTLDQGEVSFLHSVLDDLAGDLYRCLGARNPHLDAFWRVLRDYSTDTQTSLRESAVQVRRGIAKLMVLDSAVREKVYAVWPAKDRLERSEIPQYAVTLGYFTDTIAGVRLTDLDIRSTLESLTPARCEQLIQRAPSHLEKWINQLRQLQNVAHFARFVADNWKTICLPETLKAMLVECSVDPEQFADKQMVHFVGNLSGNWLFQTLLDILRLKPDSQAAYGYSDLVRLVARRYAIAISSLDIANWATGTGAHPLNDEIIGAIAGVLAEEFFEVEEGENLEPTDESSEQTNESEDTAGEESTPRLKPGYSFLQDISVERLTALLVEMSERNLLNNRILGGRHLDVLRWLIEDELEANGLRYSYHAATASWVNEYTNGTDADELTTLPSIDCGGNIFLWKSISDGPSQAVLRDLVLSAGEVRYSYAPESESFGPRVGLERIILVVDGVILPEGVEYLARGGWDRIALPGEVAEIARATAQSLRKEVAE